jgi:hypothetical protein
MPLEAKAAPKQDATPPKHKPAPLDPTQYHVDPYTAATRARDELYQLSSKARKLNTDGTITLTPVQMAFFQYDDGYLWSPKGANLLHFEGSVSMKKNYGDGLSRYLAEQILPGLQELAEKSCTATPMTDANSLQMYWGHRLVTCLCKTVTVKTRKAEHKGVLKGALSILGTSTEIMYKLRISGEHEWEIQFNMSDLADGTATVQAGDDKM